MSSDSPAPSLPIHRQLARLVRPDADEASSAEGAPPDSVGVPLVAALAGALLYGAMAGLFQGGDQIPLAALKAVLVIALALLLCVPSLWLLVALVGVAWGGRQLLATALSFAGALGLALAALAPVCWLFSVSSRRLGGLIVVHLTAWGVAVALSQRALAVRSGRAARPLLRIWSLLFVFVSLQSATYLQPILLREPGEPSFSRPRQLFLEHMVRASRASLPSQRASAQTGSDAPEVGDR